MMAGTWGGLPEVVLANVFSQLSIADKLNARETCTLWKIAADRREVWKHFIFSEKAIWEEMFDTGTPSSAVDFQKYQEFHRNVLACVKEYGKCFSYVSVTLKGVSSFEVLHVVFKYCCNVIRIKTSVFTEWLFEPKLQRQKYIQVASDASNFFQNNARMTHVRLNDMVYECQQNDPIPLGFSNAKCLQSLWIINSFRSCSLSNLMWMVNLTELAINPNHLNFSLLKHLASCSLTDLYIVATRSTKETYYEALSDEQWHDIRLVGPKLKVHVYFETRDLWSEKNSFFKRSMPLKSLVFNKDLLIRNIDEMAHILCQYCATLEEFADFGRYFHTFRNLQQTSYENRFDRFALRLVTSCSKLNTLVLKESVSSACLILLANQRQFKNLIIREDMIEYINDLPDDSLSDQDAREIIEEYFQTSEKLSAAISVLLGRAWKPLDQVEYGQFVKETYSLFLGENSFAI